MSKLGNPPDVRISGTEIASRSANIEDVIASCATVRLLRRGDKDLLLSIDTSLRTVIIAIWTEHERIGARVMHDMPVEQPPLPEPQF
jgi:hypothetical protein